MTDPLVKSQLAWGELGVLTNLARLLSHGWLNGAGRMIILRVDQGFGYGGRRSFAPNPRVESLSLMGQVVLMGSDRERLAGDFF